jgi:segregation and condensation protein A
MNEELLFAEDEAFRAGKGADPDILTIDIDGWEGPLDLLLTLARNQKVDLRAISILALTEQYLAFIDRARSLKLELAADYLVMAAWLAYLKSALLLPKDPTIDPSPEELALRLQLRLERLNAMRESGARLMARDPKGCASSGRAPGTATGSISSPPMARSRRAPRRCCTSSRSGR